MATDREAEAWDRLGRLGAHSLVEEVARLVNEAEPGAIWGRRLQADVYVLPKAEAACRAHTERVLFQHPSFAITGGSCAWSEDWPPPMDGYVGLRVSVRWPRFEDSPLMKGTTDGKPLGLRFSPEMVPSIEGPRSIEGPGWKVPGRTCSSCWFGRSSGEGGVLVCANMDSRKYALELEPDEDCAGWTSRGAP